MSEKKYRWSSAREWLDWKIEEASKTSPAAGVGRLYDLIITLVEKVDNDDIQDLFQSDMETDGFFETEIEYEKLTREQCIKILSNHEIEPTETATWDDETDENLRGTVQAGVEEEGTIERAEVEAILA